MYRFNEGFNNPFGDMDKECLYQTDLKPALKFKEGDNYIYTNQNDFMNHNYYAILNKIDPNYYLSSNMPSNCRI
jgi:hypothetical protein